MAVVHSHNSACSYYCHGSELREPLLESGSVDVYDVDPSSVLTRIQTSY